MSSNIQIQLYFNFRSPYCYLASQTMWSIFDDYPIGMDWKVLGGWEGRTPPEQAKLKIPLARQDVARWCKRLGLEMNPPPPHTDPTPAALGSLAAEKKGLLKEYIIEVMKAEWAQGQDIGNTDILLNVAENIGLPGIALQEAFESEEFFNQLQKNKKNAEDLGVIGVPTFVINDQIFWGNDRQDFVHEYLQELGLTRQRS